MSTSEVKYDLTSFDFYQDPYPTLDAIRSNCRFYNLMPNIWLATHYKDITNILKSPNFGKDFISNIQLRYGEDKAKSELIGAINRFMLVKNNPEHGQIRGLVANAFTPKMIAKLTEDITHDIKSLISSLRDAEEIDILKDLAYPFSMNVICKMIGLAPAYGSLFVEEVNQISKLNELRILNDLEFKQAEKSLEKLMTFFGEFCKKKEADNEDDIITSLLKMIKIDHRFTEQDVWANVILLFIAGHETTVNLISNGIYTLLKDVHLKDTLLSEPDLIEDYIQEIIRVESSVQIISRNVLADTYIDGQLFKKGEIIYTSLGAGNYDPSIFENPYEFCLKRDAKPLSFGGGIHYCLGALLAKLQMRIAISEILTEFPKIHLVEKLDYHWKTNLTLRGLTQLKVKLNK